jgi:hypothetical protein
LRNDRKAIAKRSHFNCQALAQRLQGVLLSSNAFCSMPLLSTALCCVLLLSAAFCCFLLRSAASCCILLHSAPFNCFLVRSVAFFCVLMRSDAFCCVLLRSAAFCCVLLRSAALCRVLLRSAAFCCILLLSIAFCCVLLLSSAFCCVLLRSAVLFLCRFCVRSASFYRILPYTASVCYDPSAVRRVLQYFCVAAFSAISAFCCVLPRSTVLFYVVRCSTAPRFVFDDYAIETMCFCLTFVYLTHVGGHCGVGRARFHALPRLRACGEQRLRAPTRAGGRYAAVCSVEPLISAFVVFRWNDHQSVCF